MPPESAETVFLDTGVYTADPRRPRAQALAVGGGRILAVGDDAEVRRWIGRDTEVLTLPGRLIVPGFRDSHIHPLTGSLDLLECRLSGPAVAKAYLEQIRRYARVNEGQAFIRGGGWLPDAFPPTGPHRADLDAVVADRPVILKAIDGHSAWVNGRALEAAGIGPATPDPPGGRIVRDDQGKPTGVLREWSAMALVESRLPPPSFNDRVTAGWAFQERASRLGIVSVHEAMAGIPELETYRELEREGSLRMRVQAALLCEPPGGPDRIAAIRDLQATFQGRLLRPQAVKIFLDGVVEGHTARLSEPYADRPPSRGDLLWERPDLQATVTALDGAGIQVHLHAIGDAAVTLALDVIEAAREANGRRDARHLIAHCDLIAPGDIPRFARLGVVAVLQPAWFYAEQNFPVTTLAYLGPRRAYDLYRIASLMAAGTRVACSSDWPFSGELNTFNPLEAIQVGATRRGLAADAAPPYRPGERVALAALLDGFTIEGARADFQENETGSLRPGTSADLAVLDRDLFAIPPDRIAEAQVLLTLFEGRPVWRAPGDPIKKGKGGPD